jgi:hypothetical protein
VGAPSIALEAFEIHPTSVIQLQYKAAGPGVAFAVCPGPHDTGDGVDIEGVSARHRRILALDQRQQSKPRPGRANA